LDIQAISIREIYHSDRRLNRCVAASPDREQQQDSRGMKEQFLLNRLVAASQAENTRNLGLQILFNRMENMSDKTLLKTIRKLDKVPSLGR